MNNTSISRSDINQGARNSLTALPLVLAVLASMVPLGLAFQNNGWLNDDAYITLTYAKNLALGRGFIYNHPPASYGTTSPLTALLIGGGGFVFSGVSLTFIAILLTAFAWVGAAWVFILWRKHFKLTLWESLLIAMFVLGNMFQYWGGENALFMFLFVLSVALTWSRKYLSAGICAGLLYMSRGGRSLAGPNSSIDGGDKHGRLSQH